MTDRSYNVLFLCTHNSARSIMAEAILGSLALNQGRFKAYSAGSMPAPQPNPFALEQIARAGLPTQGLRSKGWDEFAAPEAPRLDFVFTVCDNAAGEMCPIWPGQPMTAHWGVEDPAAVEGTDTAKWLAFREAFRELENRIKVFTSLPLKSLDRAKLQQRLAEIGSLRAAPGEDT